MEKIKAGKPTVDFIKLCYGANMPPLLCGHHGIGKSELLRQAAKELGIGYVCRDLSLMEPTDLIGMPKIKGKSTTYLPPDFLPTEGKGLLVFEELNRCERYMRSPCLQLLTDRSLNGYELPPAWLPGAVINPPDHDYEVFDLNPAIRSRFVEVMLIPDLEEWLEWARRSNVHPAVVKYVENDSSTFDRPESNPRAWKYVSDVLSAAEADHVSLQVLRAAIVGLVGPERGTAFLQSMKSTDHPLSTRDVLSSYGRHRSQVRGWISGSKLDRVEMTMISIMTCLQPKADYEAVRRNRKQWANLAKFLYDLPGDMREKMTKFFQQRKYDVPPRPRKVTV